MLQMYGDTGLVMTISHASVLAFKSYRPVTMTAEEKSIPSERVDVNQDGLIIEAPLPVVEPWSIYI